MNYQIIELEEFSVIGIKYELSKSLSNNSRLAQNYWKIFNSKLRDNRMFLGSNWCKYAFTQKIENKLFYYISIPIPKNNYILDGFIEMTVLKRKYLKVEHIGNMNKIKDTINYVFKEIIPKNNILVENSQFIYFEKYDYKFHWNREDSAIEIYIPIK